MRFPDLPQESHVSFLKIGVTTIPSGAYFYFDRNPWTAALVFDKNEARSVLWS